MYNNVNACVLLRNVSENRFKLSSQISEVVGLEDYMYETQAGKGCMQSLKLYSFWTKLSLCMGIPRDDIEIATIAS